MVAVIDYGVGNLFSVEKAVAAQGVEVTVTNDPEVIRAADKIVLPGVGAFGDCMKNLTESGLIPTIMERIEAGVPLLGICVGLQILFEGSEESPGVPGLGIIKGQVRLIEAAKPENRKNGLKVPHMGWNMVTAKEPRQPVDLFKGLGDEPFFYFVHSYHGVPEDRSVITATADYGGEVTAAVVVGNVQATQFHPEKSGDVGQKILHNFIYG
ncbi:MAG: imidazole glycerol phosphate synthase subunit HisH [Selenomonadaceae bacterium]|nr:imidazole glycerol phosphate synthase subunit HisH [Selenomonadaceae bacterium]